MLRRTKKLGLGSCICWIPQSDIIIFLQKICKQWKTTTAPAKISGASGIWEQYTCRLALTFTGHMKCIHLYLLPVACMRSRAAAQLQTTNLQRVYLLQFVSYKWKMASDQKLVEGRMFTKGLGWGSLLFLSATKQGNSAKRDGRWDRGRTSQSPTVNYDSLFSLGASWITQRQWPNTAKDVWRKTHSPSKDKKLLWYHS